MQIFNPVLSKHDIIKLLVKLLGTHPGKTAFCDQGLRFWVSM